jgi:hypothetical protein
MPPPLYVDHHCTGLFATLKTRRERNKRGGVSARMSERAKRVNPAAAGSIVRSEGVSCLCYCRLASFLGEARKEGPAGRPHRNAVPKALHRLPRTTHTAQQVRGGNPIATPNHQQR